jgi:Zn-dependent M28 family amino/carboxypeptidase
MKVGDKSFESVEKFKYLGTTLTDENFIHETIKASELGKHLPSVGPESSAVQFAMKSATIEINNYNFACCVWAWNFICHVELGTQAEGVRE